MTDLQRFQLLNLLNEGRFSEFWYTRNYVVECWDGTTYCTRLSWALEGNPPGIARTEAGLVRTEYPPVLGLPMYVEERRTYMTECAKHFVNSIISFC